MSNRREGRELALQALYSSDMDPVNTSATLKRIMDNFTEGSEPALTANSRVFSFARELLAGVLGNRAAIDSCIESKSKNWSVSRMSRVDLNILRLAVFELLYCPDIPKNVTINEAIEVAKKFGAEDSSSFVNGILDEIASTLPDKD